MYILNNEPDIQIWIIKKKIFIYIYFKRVPGCKTFENPCSRSLHSVYTFKISIIKLKYIIWDTSTVMKTAQLSLFFPAGGASLCFHFYLFNFLNTFFFFPHPDDGFVLNSSFVYVENPKMVSSSLYTAL